MSRSSPLLPVLLLVSALLLALASAIHFGLAVLGIVDPFPGARIPEAVLAVLLAGAALYAGVGAPAGRWVALVVSALAILAVLFGLTVTVPAQLWGDVAYHLTLLLLLACALWLSVRGVVGARRRDRAT